MKIKKLGHCCLLITTEKITILTDPGTFTTEQNDLTSIDVVLVTHEHADHFHLDSVKKILVNSPKAVVVTNATVGALLDAAGIAWQRVGNGEKTEIMGVPIEGYGHRHAPIYKEWGETENTGYMIDSELFYPGDSFTNPGRGVEILALPVAGPWMKISEALEYALAVKPNFAFPVHDAIVNQAFVGFMHKMFSTILIPDGIEFVSVAAGEEKEF